MRGRLFLLVSAFLVLALGGVGAVYAYDNSKADELGKGVTIGGVDVSGLTPAAARARLHHAFARRLGRSVVVRWHGRRFVLSGRQARLHADISSTVDDALARSREGDIFSRTVRNIQGSRLDVDLRPPISYSRSAVLALVSRVAAAVDRPPKEADVSFTSTAPVVTKGENGMRLRRAPLVAAVERGLVGEGARRLRPRSTLVRPHTTTTQVAQRYATVVFVDRANFRLSLYKNLKLVHTYPIAVGRQGLETPAGLYTVQDKQVDPSWHVPTSSWAGALAGKVIPPGPQDPIKARWIGIAGGAGIHGTAEVSSLGSAASHGCIRMAIPDVIQLYDQVPYGSTIYVA